MRREREVWGEGERREEKREGGREKERACLQVMGSIFREENPLNNDIISEERN